GTEHDLFSRRRDPRLQLENQLRSRQRHDAHRVDQSDCLTRRPADCQYPLGEGARSDLQSVTAVALSLADEVYRAALDLLGLTTEPVRALANALKSRRGDRSTFRYPTQ